MVDEEVLYEEYPELSFRLRRVYEGQAGRVGYMFEVRNLTETSLELRPEVLVVGWPNRAVLTQVDHDVLVPCTAETEAWEPGRVSCRTALRFVLRSEGQGLGVRRAPQLQTVDPFVLVLPEQPKGRR